MRWCSDKKNHQKSVWTLIELGLCVAFGTSSSHIRFGDGWTLVTCLLQSQGPISASFSVPRTQHCLQPACHDLNSQWFCCIEESNELGKFSWNLLPQSLICKRAWSSFKEVSLDGFHAVTNWLVQLLPWLIQLLVSEVKESTEEQVQQPDPFALCLDLGTAEVVTDACPSCKAESKARSEEDFTRGHLWADQSTHTGPQGCPGVSFMLQGSREVFIILWVCTSEHCVWLAKRALTCSEQRTLKT